MSDETKAWVIGGALVIAIAGGLYFNSTRILYSDEYKNVIIHHRTTREKTSSLYDGQTEISQFGSDGNKKVHYRVGKKHGEVVSRVVVDSEVTDPAENEVVLVGTRSRNSGHCIDVTSIDWNWNNDVLCTRPDGSQFYTNYGGGHAYDPNF